MRSLKLHSAGKLDLEANAALPIRPGYQLWRVSHVGICKTDYHLFRHPKALHVTLGHEVVVESEGKPLVLNNEVACGQCSYCLEGMPRHCAALHELGVNADGGYADFIAAPRSHLFPIEVEDPGAVATGCLPLPHPADRRRDLGAPGGLRPAETGAGSGALHP